MSGPTAEKAARGIPDRWLYCPKMGQIVENLFFPFKTPLCSLYDDQIDKEHRFHPEDVFSAPVLNGRKIGLWCDFTKTDRFYFKNEVESRNCTYCKIKMEGHGASPSEEEVYEFILTVRKFLQKRENDELVAVHCTHGFNRTGFAIVSYLVKEMDSSVEYAIQTFSHLRPCGIYKQDYINDLFQRFGDVEDCIEAPEKPSWERGEDVSLDLANIPSSSYHNRTSGSHSNATEKKFMDGKVANVYYISDISKRELLRGRIMNLCRTTREGFPGLQPVSLRIDNIHLLAQHRYKVSWKADGMRYLVYITDEGEVYAFDRDNDVFQIMNLDFPHRKHNRSIRNTLVDAEMIIDVIEQNGTSINQPRLLIYDIIQFEEFHVGAMDYDKRSSCIDHEIVLARREAMQKGRIDQQKQSMSVRLKDFWDMSKMAKLFAESFTQNLGHEIDGLIFQPITPPYVSGRCDFVLKWKPPSHNSIDFLLRIKKEERTGLLPEHWGYLYVQHQNEPFAKMKATKKLQPYDNKIIECTYDIANRVWCFMRERTDKSLPNGKNTAYNVWESIVQPITQSDLINYVNSYCIRKRPLPPPPAADEAVNNANTSSEEMEVKKIRTEEILK